MHFSVSDYKEEFFHIKCVVYAKYILLLLI